MTPTQIMDAARRRLNADIDPFWSEAECLGYLYFSAIDIAKKTYCIENRYQASSVASQREYARPTQAISIYRLVYNGKKLSRLSMREVDTLDLDLSTVETGTPAYYYEWDEVVGLYPAPATAVTNGLQMWTYDFPEYPTASSTLAIPTQYHPALVLGVTAYMASKEVGRPDITLHQANWEKALERIEIDERKRKVGDRFKRVQREEDLRSDWFGVI